MKYYLILIVAVFFGQMFVSSIAIYYYQLQNDNLDYFTAAKIYMKKQMAVFFIIFWLTILILFILSDWMNLTLTRVELLSRAKLTRLETIQSIFRSIAAIYGIGAQWVALLIFKGTRNAIINYGKSKGINIDETNKNKSL